MRQTTVAGQFYPREKKKLKETIKRFIKEKTKEKIKGLIVPHAGYPFSGKCAGQAYSLLSFKKRTYILLGTDHRNIGTSISTEDWQTPLGKAKTNQKLAKKLINQGLQKNELSHQHEHSLEVQLPFLQYTHQNNFNFVAININQDYQKTANIIHQATKDKENIVFIASSDFLHYGPNYNFIPFTENIKENIKKIDIKAINSIKKLESNNFIDYCQENGLTICGKYPIACLLEIMKKRNIKKGELIDYYTSGDIVRDYSNSVSYASIKFKK